jgi:hypothetical protein
MGLISPFSLLFAPLARPLDPAYFSVISSQFTTRHHSANKAYVYAHACLCSLSAFWNLILKADADLASRKDIIVR